MMNEKEKLYDTLLQLGTALREKRAHVYGVGWELHKEKVEAVCEADKQYMDLPLTEKRMEANECELTLTYAAGILDGIMYLRNAGFLDMYVVDKEKAKAVLKEAGISNYTIWNVGNDLFGYYECEKGVEYAARVQAGSPVVDRWNAYMKDVMVMEMDPCTGAQPRLEQVFFLP